MRSCANAGSHEGEAVGVDSSEGASLGLDSAARERPALKAASLRWYSRRSESLITGPAMRNVHSAAASRAARMLLCRAAN